MEKDWTGERLETFVLNETTIEHLHRYGIVLPFAENKTVLDIACGEGYGSNLLASKALKVIGVDIDAETIEKAGKKYELPNLFFIKGSADQIPIKDADVDLIVSFETIEHHDKHTEMMNEFKRVLKPDGILIISSPEKTKEISFNKFHIKELSRNEFTQIVASHFKFHKLYSQKIVYGSFITPVGNESYTGFEYQDGDFSKINSFKEMPDHVFNILIASNNKATNLPPSFFDGKTVLVQDLLKPYQNSRILKLSNFLKKLLFLKK